MLQKNIIGTSKLVAGISIGFSLFWLTSHPKSNIKKKIPQKEYKKFSLLPNIRYEGDEVFYHFHHWIILSLAYLPFLSSKKLRRFVVFHGLFIGSILQGLMYKDRFRFKYPKKKETYHELSLLAEK